jgi:hypothetical protein
MNDINREFHAEATKNDAKVAYVAPVVRVMTDAEVLSAFQVNATSGSMAWWTC